MAVTEREMGQIEFALPLMARVTEHRGSGYDETYISECVSASFNSLPEELRQM